MSIDYYTRVTSLSPTSLGLHYHGDLCINKGAKQPRFLAPSSLRKIHSNRVDQCRRQLAHFPFRYSNIQSPSAKTHKVSRDGLWMDSANKHPSMLLGICRSHNSPVRSKLRVFRLPSPEECQGTTQHSLDDHISCYVYRRILTARPWKTSTFVLIKRQPPRHPIAFQRNRCVSLRLRPKKSSWFVMGFPMFFILILIYYLPPIWSRVNLLVFGM